MVLPDLAAARAARGRRLAEDVIVRMMVLLIRGWA